MRTIYLIKNNGAVENKEKGWKKISRKEFAEFLITKEAKGRFFARLPSCGEEDERIVVECSREQAKKWRKEKDRHDYLQRTKVESGYQILSYDNLMFGENEVDGAEFLIDHDADVEAEATCSLALEVLRDSLGLLNKDEYDLIFQLYLSDSPLTERELAGKNKVTQQAINKRKNSILKKLKRNFIF